MVCRFISTRHARAGAAAALAALLAACAVPLKPSIAGFTCCNLRHHDGWVSSRNPQSGTIVPAGEPIRVAELKSDSSARGILSSGEPLGLRADDARDREQTLAWLHRIIVEKDPRAAMAMWPLEIRQAIDAAQVVRGMTREQVLMALGHPSLADTPDLAASTWRYSTPPGDATVDLEFGTDGRLQAARGAPSALRLLMRDP